MREERRGGERRCLATGWSGHGHGRLVVERAGGSGKRPEDAHR